MIPQEDMPVIEDVQGYTPSAFPGSNELVSEYEAPMPTQIPKLGGLIEVAGTDTLKREEIAMQRAAELQRSTVVQGVASYIQKCWQDAKSAKEQTVEERMLQNLRQRRGEYDPEVLAQLQSQHSSMVYMHITSNKCRAGGAWLRDALGDLPWACEPTPVSNVEPEIEQVITDQAGPQAIMQLYQMGYVPNPHETIELMTALKDKTSSDVQEYARKAAERMTKKMRDQLTEGGFDKALDQFIDDLTTFPAAILKGPVVRKRPSLAWTKDPVTGENVVKTELQYHLEWERVSPFDIYPAPDASDIDDGYLIERHRLSRSDLQALRDVEGYNPEAIDGALAEYRHGHIETIAIDSSRETVEGKASAVTENPSRLIEALQFWGPVPGYMLEEWGLTEIELGADFDPLDDYNIEAWLVGKHVIKLQMNPDPLDRKPYYKTSWENIPGSFWGNSIPDLCRDAQRICNACARALVNNMGIASGPQVVVDASRIPKGATVTEMYPWKIWLTDGSFSNATNPGVSFFQPGSNSQELMQIYNQFAALADEHTGIPRYMTGNSPAGGAGRTASGMSMLMSNAGKSIKAVVASVDAVMKPAIERLYFYNMLYAEDKDLKGDVNIVARGTMNLMQQETQQQRLNEFLNIALTNPIVTQLVGDEGLAYMLRQVVNKLGLNAEKIIPGPEMLRVKNFMAQQQMIQAQQMAAQQQPQNPENVTDQRRLMDGSPQANTKAA